jgi:peptidoglycan/xylan/chitin deacetylase (PgdA/CDA1 family)
MPVGEQKSIYLTFDDGPHPETTPWLLDTLKSHNAKATFFCLGKNVEKFPALFQEIKAQGHTVGSHTFSHLSGWKSSTAAYIGEVEKGAAVIHSKLFRPPYGRIRPAQYKALINNHYKVVMWSVMAYDFDASLNSFERLEKVKSLTGDGAVVVFHDSPKAFPQLKNELPGLLEYWRKINFSFAEIRP